MMTTISSYNFYLQDIKPVRGDWSRRCASLRGRATPPSSSTPTPTAPKKTNWEVIEHFTGSSGPGQTPHRLRSASLIAVSTLLFAFL